MQFYEIRPNDSHMLHWSAALSPIQEDRDKRPPSEGLWRSDDVMAGARVILVHRYCWAWVTRSWSQRWDSSRVYTVVRCGSPLKSCETRPQCKSSTDTKVQVHKLCVLSCKVTFAFDFLCDRPDPIVGGQATLSDAVYPSVSCLSLYLLATAEL